jgi:hypothetical protein
VRVNMLDNLVDKMAADYKLDKDDAQKILLLAMAMRADQPLQVRAPGTGPLQIAQPTQPIVPGEETRPPAREVDPWWYVTNTWQMLEPTVAWPTSMYFTGKAVAGLAGGLPIQSALPVKMGGASAQELFWAIRQPNYAAKLQSFFKENPSARVRITATRPKLPTGKATGPASSGAGRALAGIRSTSGRGGSGGTFGRGGFGGIGLNTLALPGVIATFENLLNLGAGVQVVEPEPFQ